MCNVFRRVMRNPRRYDRVLTHSRFIELGGNTQETEATIVGDAVLRPGMWIEMNQDRVGI